MVINLSLILIIFLAYWFSAIKLKLLTHLGAITAIIGGTIIYFAFSWKGLLLIGLFFLSSSFWSRFTGHTKVRKEKDIRNSFQVLANGGGAFVAALGYYFNHNIAWIAIFIASLAAANADTWASEIGVLSKEKPFHIKKRKRVQPGMSGAITIVGSIAALCGAVVIALIGVLLFQAAFRSIALSIFIFTCIGFLGCFLDTIIGALFEVTFKCRRCGQIVEMKSHCGYKTTQHSGYRVIGNNEVNFLTTTFSGIVGGLLFW
jgi:uncharacterized protein (TIGR00297 family)